MDFCEKMGIKPVPVTDQVVAQYAAYLARRLKPSSVRQYINIIRILHLECNFPNPCADSWYLKTTLKGIEKVKGTEVIRKCPITPQILLGIKRQINFGKTNDCVFWAACLTMFFGLLRKSNLFGTDKVGFDKDKQITKEDIVVEKDHLSVTIFCKWSKTNQSKGKIHKVNLAVIKDHPLCPVAALLHMFQAIGARAPTSQAFPMTGAAFNARLRALTARGASITSHSLRRGGATWALSCQIPGEIVKAMGQWESTCYLVYLDQIPQSVINHYREEFNKRLPYQ